MPSTGESINESDGTRVRDAVRQLLKEAISEYPKERRGERRHPFFQPVTISANVLNHVHIHSAFTREISPHGIGLLHSMPIRCGEVTLAISMKSGENVRLRAHIEWCDRCGEGWYISAGRLVDVLESP